MKYIADLHIHSPFSRATSPESHLQGLSAWARIKGIQLIGTGDFTHPAWFKQICDELEQAEPGFFRLKDDRNSFAPIAGIDVPDGTARFMLSAEVSCIYKRHGKVRKVHNLIYVPDLNGAERINTALSRIGNIRSDGRPILGLDSRDLLEIVLTCSPDAFMVPAHIWTPWFSIFGSRSGFDSIEECFGDISSEIFALETGLSSDPDMNRLVSGLDRFALISNSDCHSPSRLGREANIFDTGFDFYSLKDALKQNIYPAFQGTVEFFPEEGKYHFDGHRSCSVCLDPVETRKLPGLLCPVCGSQLTIGVHHRVTELADRPSPLYKQDSPKVFSLVPLPEILSEIHGVGPASKQVLNSYALAIREFGSEFNLLLNSEVSSIAQFSAPLGLALERVRSRQIIRHPGYDGEFGRIQLFEDGELAALGFGKIKQSRK
jgi:DNA helicase II / ATP-dependent DNA helicase PcrA